METAFCLPSSSLSIKTLRNAVGCQKNRNLKRQRTMPTASSATGKSISRCVVWTPNHLYTLVREGEPFKSQDVLVDTFKRGALKEEMLYIFCHNDPNLERNELIPKYEGVFKIGPKCFVRSQKSHLAQAYQTSKKTDVDHMWTIHEDGTPYWVDRYVFSKMGQTESKLKYESNKKSR